MLHLKRKHEFSNILGDLVPSDIAIGRANSRQRGRQRKRERRRKGKERRKRREARRDRHYSQSPSSASPLRESPSGPLHASLSPPPPISEIRAKTAKKKKRPHHDYSALSLYSEDASHQQPYMSHSSGDDFDSLEFSHDSKYDSQDSDVSASGILRRPWSEEDRARRGHSHSPIRSKQSVQAAASVTSQLQQQQQQQFLPKQPYDKFQRPSSNARWDYDEFGYLWADDEPFQHSKDKAALDKKRSKKSNISAKKYTELMNAYGDSMMKHAGAGKSHKKRQKTGARPFDSAAALGIGSAPNNNVTMPLQPPSMDPTGGSLNLPPIKPADASRSVFASNLPSNNYKFWSARSDLRKDQDVFDQQFEFLDKQHAVVQHHVYDLQQEHDYQTHKEKSLHLGIIWEIEKMKQNLPLSFLQQWGLGGEFAVNKSVKIIIRVVGRIRHSIVFSFWWRWRNEINRQIEIEFNAKMLLFQQGGALKTFEAIGRRCLKYATLSGFQHWCGQITKMKRAELFAEQEAACMVIQGYIRARQDGQRAMRSMRAVVEVALENRRKINMILSFERLSEPLVEYHRTNLSVKLREDEAAQTIRKNWNAHRSREGVFGLILATRARKKAELMALHNKMAARLQHNWRAHKDRLGLLMFRVMRRKRLEAERKARELAAEEAKLDNWIKEHRHNMADIIQRNYRTHLFIMRFNKKALERKKAKLARQLLEHKKAKIIQKNFRTYWFLVRFNAKAHERKKRWLAEAEARALKEYNAACFLQDAYRRSHSRYLMSQRFGMRKEMLLQARLLLAQNKAALVIQMAWNRHMGRENLQMRIMKRKLKEEEEKRQRLLLAQKKAIFKQRTKASKIIQKNFRTYRFLVTFNSKANERKQRWLARQLLEHNSSCVIQKNFRTYRFLVTFNSKAYERKQRWLARQLLEHESCCVIQKNYRTYRFLMAFNRKAHERKLRWMREAEIAAKEAYEKMLGEKATSIQRFCTAAMERYNLPVRILARRQLDMKRKKEQEELDYLAEVKAATVVQRAWRKKGERDMLMGRFTKRRALMEKRGHEILRGRMATVIQHCYLRHLDKKALRRRVIQRQKLHDKIAEHRIRDAKARVLQRNYRLSRARYVQSLKFEQMRKRMAAEKLLEEQTALAELAARRAAEARMAAEEALKQMVSQGWKLGSDSLGRNYWYNWVTGESTWEKPHGWKIKQDEVWVKNQDSKGNVYYFNQLTMETKWMPPCSVCNKEMGKRICQDCEFMVYCVSCYERVHDDMEGGKDHVWKAADIDKEGLKNGERYCVKCCVSAARKVCKVCRDPYCEKCFREVHAVGWLAKHPWVTWEEFKKGWQEVKGRVDGEKDYYFNATTMESTFDKPEDLMIEEELREHRLHMKYRKENERNIKRVEKLSEKVAQYQYEKDQLWFEANMKKTAEKEELELLRQQLEAAEAKKKDRLKKMVLHPIQFYREWKIEQKRSQQAYRRKLLLSAKQRRQIGMDEPPKEKS